MAKHAGVLFVALLATVLFSGCPSGGSAGIPGWLYEAYYWNRGDHISQISSGYLVSGTAFTADQDFEEIVLALDETGSAIRTQVFTGLFPQSRPGPAATVLPTAQGDVYAAGLTESNSSVFNDGRLRIVKTDASGDVIWDKSYGDQCWVPRAILEDVDACPVIALEVQEIGVYTERQRMLKIDQEGTELWTTAIPEEFSAMVMHSASMAGDGRFVLVGYDDSSNTDAALWAIDKDGNHLWYKRYDRPGWHEGLTVAQAPDGGFYVSGKYTLPSTKDRPYLLKTDSDGVFEWDKEDIYEPASAASDVEVWDMALDDEGYIAVVGDEEIVSYVPGIPLPFISSNCFMMRLDPSGNLVWKKTSVACSTV